LIELIQVKGKKKINNHFASSIVIFLFELIQSMFGFQ